MGEVFSPLIAHSYDNDFDKENSKNNKKNRSNTKTAAFRAI